MNPEQPHPFQQIFQARIQNLAISLQPNTLYPYRATANNFLHYLHAEYPQLCSLSQLRRDPHILGWLRHLRGRVPPLCNATRLSYSICLRRLLDNSTGNGDPSLAQQFISSEDLPHLDLYLPKPLALEDDQLLHQQLRADDDLLSNTLLLLRSTGMRIGECLHLTPDSLRHLDHQQWALHVPLGKLHTERWIPVDDNVRQIYARLLCLRHDSPAAAASPFLLPQPSGHRNAHWAVAKALKSAARRAGCSVSPTPHQLRHTFATGMIRAGISLPALMHLLGHKSLSMTLRYVQITSNDVQREYAQACQKLGTRHHIPQLVAISSAATTARISTIANSLATLGRLLEIQGRQSDNSANQSLIHRLSKRLTKIARQINQLPDGRK
jgi:site-specific recombinase XerD